MKGFSNFHKRKSSLKTNVKLPLSKSMKRSSEENLLDKMKPKEDYTREERLGKYDEDNNVNKHDDNDEEDEDNNVVNDEDDDEEDLDDHKDEAEYLLGDEGPPGAEEELKKGVPTKDADDEENEICKRKFSHGFHKVQGKLDHGMEDYTFAQHKNINGYDLGLYAIFDGHAGRDVAEYLQTLLFPNILNEPDFWENPVRAVKRAFKATDDEILENIVDWRGGSTAVTAILINGVKLLVANVGDSRAISCKNGVAKQITVDHDPEREKDLVESRGGFVIKRPGNVARVDGQLAMTRAFGDGKLKEHITAEPDVMVQYIDEDTDFIILASDGLWKVMTNQEACDCIKYIDDAQKASKKLVKEALSQGSYDDISCIVVMF